MKHPLRLVSSLIFLLAGVFAVTDPERWWRYLIGAALLSLIFWMSRVYGKAGGHLPM